MYYLKNRFDSTGMEFVERIVEGKINIYKKRVFSETYASIGIPFKSDILYVEKDDVYFVVFISKTIGQRNDFNFNYLKEMVSDDDKSLKRIIAENFKQDSESIISLIRNYNLNFYEDFTDSEEETGKVIFFRVKKNQNKEPIKLYFDGQEYSVQINDKVELSLPVSFSSKVCIGYKSKVCDLVSGSPYFNKFFEISLDKDGNLSIQQKDKEYAAYYLKLINYVIKKRK